MDWNKISGLAGIGIFVLTAVIVGLMVWPLQPGQPPSQAATRPMTGWVPIIVLAACVLLAGWLHLKAARLSGSASHPPQARTSVSHAAPVATNAAALPAPRGDGRVFLNKSVADLVAPFTSGLTGYQAKQIVADYLNNWVRWIGPIYNVQQYGENPNVSANIADAPRPAIYLTMSFIPSEAAKIMHLEKGTMIEIEGKVADLSEGWVSLRECLLVRVSP